MSYPLRDAKTRVPDSVVSEATAHEPNQLATTSSPTAVKSNPKDVEQGMMSVNAAKPEGEGKIVDAVWGEIDGDGPGYRTLSWYVW